MAYDHCTLRGSVEYLRIKSKDLAFVTHENYPLGIVYVPFLNTDLGMFVLKVDKNFTPDNFGNFLEWS